jgi:putative FmdB family regulatory protein
MPIYEYRCRDCQTRFETLVRGDRGVTCPQCGSRALDKLLSATFVRSEQAVRPPGRTCCGREDRCATPPCSEGGICQRG